MESQHLRGSAEPAPPAAIRGAAGKSEFTAGGIKDYLPAAALLLTVLVALSVGWFATAGNSGQYLVVAPPDATLPDTLNLVRVAGGRLAAAGYFPNIVIAGSSRPDFTTALRAAGAWVAVSVPPQAGCVGPSSQEQNL
jgi:hypothetical protein